MTPKPCWSSRSNATTFSEVASKTTVFASSRQGLIDIEESHDFFDGSAAALESLRLEIVGLRTIYPETPAQRIMARYSFAKKPHGSNAYNLIVRRDWDDVTAIHNRMRLINLISVYEAWTQAVASELAIPAGETDRLVKALSGLGKKTTLKRFLGSSPKSMKGLIDACGGHPYYMPEHLDRMLLCFRAFKEVRNSLAHRGNVASKRTEKAWLKYHAEAANWSALTRTPPDLPQVIAGQPVTLNGEGVVHFAQVLQRMIITFDCELAATEPALSAILGRWRAKYGKRTTLSSDPHKAIRSFQHRLQQLGLPQVADPETLLAEFRKSGVVF